ncbi:MAG: PDZ domain-containing protein [Magnetococcales bacterium]|nr:PDZ domain-containing protein [Magnetococcales bacterium]
MTKPMTILALSAALLLTSVQPTQAAGGWLGLHPEPPRGVGVGDIIKDSPADKSGLIRGDVIVRLNGHEITSISQFSMEIHRLDPGVEVTLVVWRNGETKEIKAKLEASAGHTSTMVEDKSPQAFNRSPLFKPSFMSSMGAAHTHDYQARMKGAISMLEAYERIAEEKKLGDKGKQTAGEIRDLLNQAQKNFDKYQINAGMPLMERAYNMAQEAIVQLRKGETLYQPLHFPNPEAEFVYEVGRNNAFQMWLDQALNPQNLTPEISQKTEEANSLRRQAEANAAKGDFKGGIGQLEQATNILIELLRQAKIDIP